MSVIKEKKVELAAAIEKEIKETIIGFMDDDFVGFVSKLLQHTRDDQLERLVGKDLVELMKEYKKVLV
jgi:hypothetical protein